MILEGDYGIIADFLEKRVCYRRDDYAVQLDSGRYVRMGSPLTHDDIMAHLRGEMTIGVYQSKYPEEYCKWIVYDIDGARKPEDNPEIAGIQKKLLKSVLIDNGVPFYVEDSGSPDSVHLWVFLFKPTPLHIAYNWARAMTVRGSRSESPYNLSDGEYVFSGEIFPKQAALNPDKPFGNLVKVPFGIHQLSGRRTYFFDSSRGKPHPYMSEIETIDISHWQPVDLPKNERGSKITKVSRDNPEQSGFNVFTEGQSVGLYRYSQNVRPCIRHMLETNMQLEHYDGHMLRIAVASELLQCGLRPEQVVESFKAQKDFNYEKCSKQVSSVQGYNRPSCHRIRWHTRNLRKESGFNIDELCNSCVFAESQEMNHAKQIYKNNARF